MQQPMTMVKSMTPRRATLMNRKSVRNSVNIPDTHLPVVADRKAIKAKLKEDLYKPRYDVKNFYKDTGCCQAIARSDIFENVTLGVISLNALWISLDIDLNTAETLLEAHPAVISLENFFCLYFFGEWAIRCGAFKFKRNCLKDAWFLFDTFMVAMMVSETWIMTAAFLAMGIDEDAGTGDVAMLRILRLLRLTRMARLARLLRSCPEILILIKGMLAALRSVFFTLLLIVLCLYVFAILLRQLADGTPTGDEWFATVPRSANKLVVYGIFGDNLGDLSKSMMAEESLVLGVIMWIVLFIFILLTTITALNMLIGVLCQVVSQVGETEREELQAAALSESLWPLMEPLLVPGEDPELFKITKADFISILNNPDAAPVLKAADVDIFAVVDLVDTIFAPDPLQTCSEKELKERKLQFGEMVAVLLDMRSKAGATFKDLAGVRTNFDFMMDDYEANIVTKFHGIQASLQALKTLVDKKLVDAPVGSVQKKSREAASGANRVVAKGGADPPKVGWAKKISPAAGPSALHEESEDSEQSGNSQSDRPLLAPATGGAGGGAAAGRQSGHSQSDRQLLVAALAGAGAGSGGGGAGGGRQSGDSQSRMQPLAAAAISGVAGGGGGGGGRRGSSASLAGRIRTPQFPQNNRGIRSDMGGAFRALDRVSEVPSGGSSEGGESGMGSSWRVLFSRKIRESE